ELGDVQGCEVLATWLSEHEASLDYWQRGRTLREQGCEAGTREDCIVLGAYYVRGLGVDKDFSRAVDLYGKACEAGSSPACTARAQILITGTGVEPNYEEAFRLFARACE